MRLFGGWREMKRLTSTGLGALVLAALFFFGGLVLVILPKEMKLWHVTYQSDSGMQGSYFEDVTKGRARFYGVMAMLLGTGLAVFIIFPKKR
jgi:hypothetical protein